MKKLTILQIVFLVIFLGSAGWLGKYFYDSHKAQNDMAELQASVVEKLPSESFSETNDGGSSDNKEPERAQNGMLIEYYDLYQKNNDMVGWLKIDGTKINYPVMYSSTGNDYYLHKNFDKEYQYSGLPFLDYQCSLSDLSTNLIIYAHNMKDGTMFATLLDYEDESFYKQHPIISFSTLYENMRYEIIGVFRTKVGSKNEFQYYNFINAKSENEFKSFIETVERMSLYDTGLTAEYGDNLLTLSTCSYNTTNERFVVVAKQMNK